MKPNYVAKKSAWAALKFWPTLIVVVIAAALAVAPIIITGAINTYTLIGAVAVLALYFIIVICKIIVLKCDKVEFYDDKVVQKSGVFARHERQSVFIGIRQVEIHQSFFQRILKYGTVTVDVIGHWDIDLTKIKFPKRLRSYLAYHMEQEAGEVTHIISG
ncbi:MAG: PH domain-containing protein [Clostridia bacterium]|nr:PH domain-containing protein [Clostridia bacterium]